MLVERESKIEREREREQDRERERERERERATRDAKVRRVTPRLLRCRRVHVTGLCVSNTARALDTDSSLSSLFLYQHHLQTDHILSSTTSCARYKL